MKALVSTIDIRPQFELINYGHCWSEVRVSFHDQEGRFRSFPASWTSVAAPDPFVVVSAGRSLFRVKDLLALASLLRELSSQQTAVKV